MIQFGNSGRSCFIVYEHPDAVATAKEIYRGVRICGRSIQFFDQNDINEIHAQQEVEVQANEERKRNSYHPQRSGYSSNLMQDPRAFAMNFNHQRPMPPFMPDFNRSQSFNTHIRFNDHDQRDAYSSPSKYAEMRSDLMPAKRASRPNDRPFSHSSPDFRNAPDELFPSMKNPYSSPVPRNRYSEDDVLPPGVSNDEFKRDRNFINGPNRESSPERSRKHEKFDNRDQREDNRWRKHDNRDYNSKNNDNRYPSSRKDDRNHRFHSRNNDYAARNRHNNHRDRKFPEYRHKGRY